MIKHRNIWLAYSVLALLSAGLLLLIFLVGANVVRPPSADLSFTPLTLNAGTAVRPEGWVEALRVALHHPLSQLLAQVIVIILCARLCGYVLQLFSQPRVIGEILSGILLGPSLIGAAWPEFSHWIFPADSLPKLQLLSQIGLILFMFIVGMEVNVATLKSRAREAVLISHVSVVFPFLLGAILAIWLYGSYAGTQADFTIFALFLGIAMSITAFPVLARILMDRNLTKTPLGTMALTCAAIDDVTAWCLLAIVIALAQSGTAMGATYVLLLAVVYVVTMLWVVRPIMTELFKRLGWENQGHQAIMIVVLVMLLASALSTELIGLHALFGAFIAGVIMPTDNLLRQGVAGRLTDVSTLILLPLFFAFTGLRTDIGLLDSMEAWLICIIIIAVAVIGKLGGSALIGRWSGMAWPEALSLGVLMSTRGLMELVVLNIGYDLGILSDKLFTMMVLMAVVTTLMAGPLLTWIETMTKRGVTPIHHAQRRKFIFRR